MLCMRLTGKFGLLNVKIEMKGRAKLQCLKLWSGEVSVIWSTVQFKLTSEVLSSLYNISNVQSDDIYVYG